MEKSTLQSRFRGCLLAGAAGDALGYPVEFESAERIRSKYGKRGITQYDRSIDPQQKYAVITDDTQMTLFTAEGLLEDKRRRNGASTLDTAWGGMYEAYLDWLYTQEIKKKPKVGYTKLMGESRLHERRAPGNTCLAALRSGNCGSMEKPINYSKGCGGVMRAAPVGLYFGPEAKPGDVLGLGGQCAAITHGHPLGYLPAAALALMVHTAVWAKEPITLGEIWARCREEMEKTFAHEECLPSFLKWMDRAQRLALNELTDQQNIKVLGEGWVGDEALAISLYCALRHEGNLEETLVAAVNHDGDSDSTGAIAGNLCGALIGEERIPAWMLKDLELSDVVLTTADAMFAEIFSE